MSPIEENWRTLRLPLDHYARRGVDLSRLVSLELVFEWNEQSGTMYVDDVRFESLDDNNEDGSGNPTPQTSSVGSRSSNVPVLPEKHVPR